LAPPAGVDGREDDAWEGVFVDPDPPLRSWCVRVPDDRESLVATGPLRVGRLVAPPRRAWRCAIEALATWLTAAVLFL
jgi:hypothetical protein